MFIWEWVSIAFGWLVGILVVNLYYSGCDQRNN